MTDQHRTPFLSQDFMDKLGALPPEVHRRISAGMELYCLVNESYNQGILVAGELLEGKMPAADVGMQLLELERSLRLTAAGILDRTMRVAYSEAVRRGETRLDEESWIMRARTRAEEALKAREERGAKASPETGAEGGARPRP